MLSCLLAMKDGWWRPGHSDSCQHRSIQRPRVCQLVESETQQQQQEGRGMVQQQHNHRYSKPGSICTSNAVRHSSTDYMIRQATHGANIVS